MRKLTRRTSAVAGGLVALTGVGVAFAAWSSTGAGTGSAASTTSQNSVIAGVSPVPADNLYPGAVKSAKVTISNPNAYPVEVTAISAGWSRVVNTTCAAGTVRTDSRGDGTTALTQSDGSTTSIPGGGSGTYTLTLKMADSPDDACKSQSFTLGLASTPASDMTASLRSAASGNGF